ncbi:MAG: transposase [Planctomycetales bacterium]
MATSQPLYRLSDQSPAYQLRYSWCGWTETGNFQDLPADSWTALTAAWETDDLRLLKRSLQDDTVQLTFSATPSVSPIFLAARAKGRLQHALRKAKVKPVEFSRKLAVRSIGDNTASDVEKYIESQVSSAGFVDADFAKFLEQFTVNDRSIDLSQPTESNSGRYWYNLHLVLVTDGRHRFVDEPSLRQLRDGSLKIGAKKGYRISALSVMPDHLHVALRGAIDQSPDQIALAFQNNLAFMVNRGAIWRPGFYVGTFGEYNMNAIRMRVRAESASPATLGGR